MSKRRSHIKRAKLLRGRMLAMRSNRYCPQSARWFRTTLPLFQAMCGYYQD